MVRPQGKNKGGKTLKVMKNDMRMKNNYRQN